MRTWIAGFAAVMVCALVVTPAVFGAEAKSVLNHEMETLSGDTVNLTDYEGKVCLIVNVASKCGLTPHYKGLQALHEKYGDQGLVVIGVPCNQFGGQEPGSAEEIASFCEKNYGVEFAMMAKVDVNGDGQCDLYKQLTSEDTKPAGSGPIKWNFEKFVIGKDGGVVARFSPPTTPDAEELVSVIEAELAK